MRERLKSYIPEIVRDSVRRGVHYFHHIGFRFHCPLCGKHFRKFIPNKKITGMSTIEKYRIIAMGQRKHFACPWCRSTDKERLVWFYLVRKTDLCVAKKKVLHIAPEMQIRKKLAAMKNIEYMTGDKFEGDARYRDGRYGDAAYADITDMRFPDEKFDLIICNHVLEHVEDDKQAMREICRVLKRGGIGILQVPVSRHITNTIEDNNVTDPEEREKTFGQRDHVRIYAEEDYLARLREAKLQVSVVVQTEILSAREIEQMGLNPEERVYVATKV